jgi:hypothetical protein
VHTAAVLRLGLTEKGLTEIIGLAEHVVSLCAGAEGLRIRPDVPDEPNGRPTELVAPCPEDAVDTLVEIRNWTATALGVDRAPVFWRVLAHQPRLLAATWAKDRLVLGPGELDGSAKTCVALAVAMFKQSPYWTSYLSQLVRRTANLDDAGLVELAGNVMHYVAYNTIAHGMRLEPPYANMTAAEMRAE